MTPDSSLFSRTMKGHGGWSLKLCGPHRMELAQRTLVSACRADINACKKTTDDAHLVNAVLGDLKSLHDVGNLWEAQHLKQASAYHAVVYLRADAFYKQDFPVEVLDTIKVILFYPILHSEKRAPLSNGWAGTAAYNCCGHKNCCFYKRNIIPILFCYYKQQKRTVSVASFKRIISRIILLGLPGQTNS